MNLQHLISSDLVYRVGWTLLHSLWQGAAIAALLALVLTLLRRRSPNARYVCSAASLGAILLLPLATFQLVPSPSGAPSSAPDPGARSVLARSPMLPPVSAPAIAAAPSPGAPGERGGEGLHWLREHLLSIPRILNHHLPFVVSIWLLGVCTLSLWHFGGWVAAQRLRVLGTRPVTSDLQAMLAKLLERLPIRRPVRIVQSLLVDTPMVIGFLRPLILIPPAILTGLTPAQLEAILAHELAHIHRYDYLVNLLQTAVETLLFYHPAVWWVSARMRLEREQCCDDMAVPLCHDRTRYAEALAAIEQTRLPIGAATLAARGSGAHDLIARIQRILNLPQPRQRPLRPLAALLLIAGLLVLAIGLDLGAAVPSSTQTTDPDRATVREIVRAVRFPAQQIRDLSCTITSRGRTESTAYPRDGVKVIDRWYERSDGRLFVVQYINFTPSFYAYDGIQAREEQPSLNRGFILKEKKEPSAYGLRRPGFGVSVMDMGIDQLLELALKEGTVALEETREPDLPGRLAKITVTLPHDPRGSTLPCFARLWLDVDKGYMPRRTEEGFLEDQRRTYVLRSRMTRLELRELAPKVWYPVAARVEVFPVAHRADPTRPVEQWQLVSSPMVSADIAISDIKVNQGLADSVFDLEFPAGTTVSDQRTNTVFVVGADFSRVPVAAPDVAGRRLDVQAGEVALPEGSRIDEHGRIIDKIDYPFVNDPDAIGKWESVDFVKTIEDFDPKAPRTKAANMLLRGLVLSEGGKVSSPWKGWTKGLLMHEGDKTASKYVLKKIDNVTYVFLEWKSGAYVLMHRQPFYYVLKKVASDPARPDLHGAAPPGDGANFSHAAATQPADSPSAPGPASAPAAFATPPTPEQIAAQDRVMRALLDQRIHAEAQLTRLRRTLGPSHRAVVRAQEDMEFLDGQITERTAQYNRNRPPATNPTEAEVRYYISGVPRPGVYVIPPRRINLLQAVISAGMDPAKSQSTQLRLIRREGPEDREQTYTFTLKQILEQRDLDTFLLAGDVLMLGDVPMPATRGAATSAIVP